MASLTFAYFLTLAFESPIIAIEKVLFKKEKGKYYLFTSLTIYCLFFLIFSSNN